MAIFADSARQRQDGGVNEIYDDCVVKVESPSNQSMDPCSHDGLANNDDFLPIPDSKASKSTFPPGCPVVMCCYNGTIASKEPFPSALAVSQILRGTVVHAGINLADDGNRETLYQVQVSGLDNTTIIRHAHDLQFAISTPVWLWNNDTDKYRPAIIIGSEHFPAFTENKVLSSYVLYSAQVVVGNCKVYHGILLDKLIYRSSEQPPGHAAEKASAHVGSLGSGAQTGASVNDVPDEMAQSSLADEVSELEDGDIVERSSHTVLKKLPEVDSDLEASETDEATHPPTEIEPFVTSPPHTTRPMSDNDADLKESKITDSIPKTTRYSLLSEFTDAADITNSSDHYMDLSVPEFMEQRANLRISDNESMMDKSPDNIQATSYGSSNESPADIASTPTIPIPVKTDVLSKSIGQTQLATESNKPVRYSQNPKDVVAVQPPIPVRDNQVVRVVNSNPSPFQSILFGADHSVGVVKKELQTLTDPKNNHPDKSRWWDVREVLCHRRCLQWQLNGRCWSDCQRSHDHVRLNPKLADAMEDALKPWIKLSGPIFCHPVTPTCGFEQGGNNLADTSQTRQTDGDPEQIMEKPPAAKRRKLQYYVADPQKKLPEVASDLENKARARQCYHCGRLGHMAADCKWPAGLCFNCGQKGHIAKKCPGHCHS